MAFITVLQSSLNTTWSASLSCNHCKEHSSPIPSPLWTSNKLMAHDVRATKTSVKSCESLKRSQLGKGAIYIAF